MTDPLVPVFSRYARGFPLHDAGEPAAYAPLSEVLTYRFDSDMHFAAYSLPVVARRLGGEGALGLGPKMVLFVVDVEPEGHAKVTPEWWASERAKLDQLLIAFPNGYIYRTRGGYRIVYKLSQPLELRNRSDAARWRNSYLSWLAGLRDGLGIVGDIACGDWTRCYRLPLVTRDGIPQEPEVIGDPKNIGGWDVEYTELIEIPDVAKLEIQQLADEELPAVEVQETAARALAQAWPTQGGRHEAHMALSGALARAGWGMQAIANFCAAVAEISDPGTAQIDVRQKNARDSIQKLEDGAVTTGWPKLTQLIGEDAVSVAMTSLGMSKHPPQRDPNFVESIIQGAGLAPPVPITPKRDEFEAAMQIREKRLLRSSKVGMVVDGKLLRRVRHGELLVEEGETQEETIVRAARAIVRNAPDGTTDEQICTWMSSSAGALHGDIAGILAQVRQANAQEVSAEAPLDEFVIATSGPLAGLPVPASQHNFSVALTRLGVKFRYNEFADVELMKRGGTEVIVEDKQVKALRFEIDRTFHFRPPKDDFYDYCEVLGDMSKFHPVRDYIDSLPDNVPLTGLPEEWLIRYAGAQDTPYIRAVSRIILVAAVRRVRQPGCKFDEMMILESPQGFGKSSLLRMIVPNEEWFTGSFEFSSDTRKMMEITAGRWIIEAGELRGMNQKEHAEVKQYLSQVEDTARLAYARKPRRMLRQFVIVGTTNDEQYLRDSTGNRRYWPIEVGRIDVEGITAIRNILWAEAARLDLEHPEPEYIRLDPSLYSAAAVEQEQREVEDPFATVLGDTLGQMEGKLRKQDVWKLCGYDPSNVPPRIPSPTEFSRIKAAMAKVGWRLSDTTVDGNRMVVFRRGNGDMLRVTGSPVQGYSVLPEIPVQPN